MDDIREALYAARTPYYPVQHYGSGFYAIFLKSDHTIPNLHVPDDGLLYIGETGKGFTSRDHVHPSTGHSGYCTLRRSIGALLKDQLELTIRHRKRYSPDTHSRYFHFRPDAEIRLSNWMEGALYVARVPYNGDAKAAEKQLISQLQPPLNLTDWKNPQSPQIKHLRDQCFKDAIANFPVVSAA